MPTTTTSFLRSFVTPKQHGLRYTVSLIPGDGVGREVCEAVKEVLKAAHAPIDWDEVLVSGHDPEGGAPSDDGRLAQVIESLKRNRVGLKGTFFTPRGSGHRSFNLAIRKQLNIYANVVHARSIPGVSTRHPPIDIAIIRENTEGEYSNLEHQPQPGVVESLKVITREKSQAIIRFAFDWAIHHGRQRITCVQKANIMKMTDGLFLNTFREVANEYKLAGLQLNEMIIDNTSMQLVSKPGQFDVIVTPNLYGNIVSNICAGLIGSAGLLPGYNLGPGYALYEPGARHMARSLRAMDKANPTSMLLSSVMMLRHLGLDDSAGVIESAIFKTISEGRVRTPDLPGGTAKMSEFIHAIIRNL